MQGRYSLCPLGTPPGYELCVFVCVCSFLEDFEGYCHTFSLLTHRNRKIPIYLYNFVLDTLELVKGLLHFFAFLFEKK